ncbi:retron system putative HNH endonuclease [Myxococcus sp. NMCA1]|uniref:retron system putative HNH endonuclease n=1 Tax=Myxococcus sp. NMCA1 TaxID=2996785 RepID=UPI0022866C28|nr:retron system putative HNH endonuclease [Myxococcus sp. NMCA1]WAM25166.1 TIGR02646 family protein [Myxococcus sp. NMCA1]
MKHVRALAAEPPLLAQYRASSPGEEKRPASEATATWDSFKDDRPAYAELRAKLAKAQQGLCIYCEQRLVDGNGKLVPNDYQVEHVQPKSGAVGRVLDWQNLALACGGGTYTHHSDSSRVYTTAMNTSCGQTKDALDLPQGCDPRLLPLVDPIIEVGIDGKLLVHEQHCVPVGVASQNAKDAIELLNLDCERLRKARQDIGDNTRSWFVFMLEELLSPQLTVAQKQNIVDLLVARRLQPDSQGFLSRFWSTERSAIGAPAESWLASNQTQFA